MWRLQKADRRARRSEDACAACAVRQCRPSRRKCEQCLEYDNQAKKNGHARFLAAGLCVVCGKAKPPTGRLTCVRCCAISTSDQKARRARRVAQGACSRCGVDRDDLRFKECATCREFGRNRYTEALTQAGKKRHAEIVAERVAIGRCPRDGAKLADGACAACEATRHEKYRRAHRRKRQLAMKRGTCTTCAVLKPQPGYKVCRRCIDRTIAHQKRVRQARPRVERGPRTHCRNGHLFDDRNTHVYKGRRRCRACVAAAGERYRERKGTRQAVAA